MPGYSDLTANFLPVRGEPRHESAPHEQDGAARDGGRQKIRTGAIPRRPLKNAAGH